MWIPSVWLYMYDEWITTSGKIVHSIIRLLLSVLFLEFFVLIKRKSHRALVLILFFISFFADVTFLYAYKGFHSTSSMLALFNTTKTEALQYITLNWVLYFVVLVVLFVFGYLALKLNFSLVKSSYSYKLIKLVGVLLILLGTQSAFTYFNNPLELGLKSSVKLNVLKHYPVNFYYRLYEKVRYDQKKNQYLANVKSFSFDASVQDSVVRNNTVVFIIGETQRADLYHQELAKHTDQLQHFDQFNFVPLPNFYSTANSTAYSFPLMVTRATASNPELSFNEPSIAKLFSEAGYKTFWLANQNLFKGPEGKSYKEEVDVFKPLWKQGGLDTVVWEPLKEIVKDTASLKFLLINLKGNHYRYEYPEVFELYQPNLESENVYAFDKSNELYFRNSYNNNTAFQLSILDSIHSIISEINGPTSLFFSSDHGESMFEPPHYFFGHGTSTLPLEQVHCFSYFWFNNYYIKQFKGQYENINNNSSQPYSFDYIFETLADLGGVHYQGKNVEYSMVYKEPMLCDTIKVRTGESITVIDVSSVH
ncbi:sulfatase-like hydrolase/transferase [Carboxylicivirga linearis]|uniref:Sulfatase-like hydrolase/transferase n=1 Tax=Carboxylicivirga linearis TaxID=1628157 RepID=A0ABS5JVY5_9BACT|nr:sulfatase-like hydrolase/transferase [Carboxylicivirga linearis]